MTSLSEIKRTQGPYKADKLGGIIRAKDGFHFADVRGWGELQYQENGEAIQDANLEFMEKSLNSHDKLVELVELLLENKCSCCKDPEFKILGHSPWCSARQALQELR